MLVALCGLSANAENKIVIDNISVDAGKTVSVPVLLYNDANLINFQFDVVLPEGLEPQSISMPAVATERMDLEKDDFLSSMLPDSRTLRVLTVSWDLQPNIKGESGTAVCELLLTADKDAFKNGPLEVKVEGITFCTTENPDVPIYQDPFTVTASAKLPYLIGSLTPDPFTINPGQQSELTLAIDNEADCYGLQFGITLPEGLTYVANSIKKDDRVLSSTRIQAQANDNNTTGFALFDMQGRCIFNAGSGAVATLTIEAAADYNGEGVIEINHLHQADYDGNDIPGKDFQINIVTGKAAYDEAMTQVAALETALTTALAQIAEVAPDVADQFTGAEITAQIEALKAAINEAYAAGAVNFDEQLKAVETINAAITALVADAEKAQADKVEGDRVAANEAAYEADMAKIADLRKDLKNVILEIEADYFDYRDVRAQAAVEEAIDQAEAAVKAALAAVAEEGTYTSPLDVEALTAQINGLLEAAQAKADLAAANKAAYQADLDRLAALEGEFELAKVTVNAKYPDYKDPIAETQVSNALRNAATAIERAYAAVAKEGTYESPVDFDAIDAQIKALVADAQAKANAAAAQADLDKLNDLINLLESGKDVLPAEDYARYQGMIDGLTEEINDALAAANENGTDYVSPANLDSRISEIEGKLKTDIDMNGIADIIANPEQSGAQIFNLQGQQITNPAKGQVVIVRTATTTAKVVVK